MVLRMYVRTYALDAPVDACIVDDVVDLSNGWTSALAKDLRCPKNVTDLIESELHGDKDNSYRHEVVFNLTQT